MTVGERLKQLREKSGLSQVDLATKINVTKQTLYKYENDIITNIPSDKIECIAKVLNVSPSYIMGWTQYDETFSGKEASDDKVVKLALNIQKFHGSQKALNENYEQLSDHNKKKVVDYSDTLLKIQKMEEEQESLMPQAAHECTNTAVTAEMVKHDDDIMDDPNF